MGFRMRKSLQIVPGVRLNFSKTGIGYSVGVKGYRVTHRADGRVQRTASLPGTGLSHVTTSGSSRSTGTQRRTSGSASGGPRSGPEPPAAPSPKPGLFAPRGVKVLYAAVQGGDADAIDAVAATYPDLRLASATLAGLLKFGTGQRAEDLLSWVWSSGSEPADDPFIQKYVHVRAFELLIAPGVTADLRIGRTAIGLALAELLQGGGQLEAAVDVVESLEPYSFAAVSLAELYAQTERWADVVTLTDGVTNEDDSTALLCVLRGEALREQGYFDSSRAALREALSSKARDPVIRHRAWLERARTYEAEGKRSLARKDLERIMAEDSTYPGLAESLAELTPDGHDVAT